MSVWNLFRKVPEPTKLERFLRLVQSASSYLPAVSTISAHHVTFGIGAIAATALTVGMATKMITKFRRRGKSHVSDIQEYSDEEDLEALPKRQAKNSSRPVAFVLPIPGVDVAESAAASSEKAVQQSETDSIIADRYDVVQNLPPEIWKHDTLTRSAWKRLEEQGKLPPAGSLNLSLDRRSRRSSVKRYSLKDLQNMKIRPLDESPSDSSAADS